MTLERCISKTSNRIDALGRRIQRLSTASGTTKFVYDGPDVLRDLDGSGNTVADYLNGPGIDNKVRQTAGGTVAYFATDHLGSTRALTGASGNSTPSGTKFHWHAEFLNDATHKPECCEVRQLISWNRGPFGPNTVPHPGFPPWAQPGTWLEDRDEYNKRYGRRTGPYADPSLNDINGNEYHSDDQPGPTASGTTVPGFALRFRLIVVDVCQGGKRIYTSKTITVNF